MTNGDSSIAYGSQTMTMMRNVYVGSAEFRGCAPSCKSIQLPVRTHADAQTPDERKLMNDPSFDQIERPTGPACFPPLRNWYDQIGHFHELFAPTTPLPPLPFPWSAAHPLRPWPINGCTRRWALGVGTSSRMLPDSKVRVVRELSTPACICVYYSLVFAARGRLAEIDPIPGI